MNTRAGIIAAGDGLRLQGSYPGIIKPMVPVLGRPLIQWTVSGLAAAGVKELVVVLNSRGQPARRFLEGKFPDLRWTFLVADTKSSWESFRWAAGELSRQDPGGRFLLSTVDAFIPALQLARFAGLWQTAAERADAALALTRHVADEKPLWADLGPDGSVSALGSECRSRELVTCGLYALSAPCVSTLPPDGAYSSLREFWGSLVLSGRRVLGFELDKTVDIDRPEDIADAESLLEAG